MTIPLISRVAFISWGLRSSKKLGPNCQMHFAKLTFIGTLNCFYTKFCIHQFLILLLSHCLYMLPHWEPQIFCWPIRIDLYLLLCFESGSCKRFKFATTKNPPPPLNHPSVLFHVLNVNCYTTYYFMRCLLFCAPHFLLRIL